MKSKLFGFLEKRPKLLAHYVLLGVAIALLFVLLRMFMIGNWYVVAIISTIFLWIIDSIVHVYIIRED